MTTFTHQNVWLRGCQMAARQVFDRARAGLSVSTGNAIMVNMLGRRSYDLRIHSIGKWETAAGQQR